ncbi:MAG: hypothetical protein ABL998_23620, partial [Planctomycetota bacterium]
ATLLEYLGAPAAERRAWTLGENLLAPLDERKRVFAGWNELGVWTDDAILRVPLALLDFDVEAYDYGWQRIQPDLELLRRERGTLEALGADCNRFLQR